jgi:hypothetical protein
MRLLLLILVFTLYQSSCNEKDTSPSLTTDGEAFAKKNGVIWESFVVKIDRYSVDENFSLILNMLIIDNQDYPRENFSIFRIKNSFNRQLILNSKRESSSDSLGVFYSTLIDDGDVVGDIYELDTSTMNNFIQITNYNSIKNQIEGIFNVSLIISRDDGIGEVPPEKIDFIEGKFKVNVEKDWFD